MKGVLEYKGYHGTVEYSAEDNILFGSIIGITSLISYEAQSTDELKVNFESAVDEYLELCAEKGISPKKKYKGVLNKFYPAIFTKEENGYSVRFPDFPGCFTEGDTLEEAYKMATCAIGLYAQNEDGEFEFPEASEPNSVELVENEFSVLVEFDVLEYLKNTSEKAVKKTLTIPSWLNSLAEQNNVNFSKVVQTALKEHLGV